jgi:glutathione S-transferase
MKLYYNPPSPYARKVLVAAHEKGLMERIELLPTDPWKDPPELLAATPVGKVPALLTADGTLIVESTTIAEYLDEVGEAPRLVAGDRTAVMARTALAQGLIDASFGIVIERRRPKERQWSEWLDRLRRAVDRTLPRLAPSGEGFDLGDISLACGLAYLDFRLPEIPWRSAHPALAGWLDQVSHRPSMRATKV